MPRKVHFDKMVSFRLPSDIAKSWQKAADDSKMSLTDFIRSQVEVDGVDKFIPTKKTSVPKLKYVAADPKLIQQVARIGNNLNQISRFCHRYKSATDAIDISQHLVSIEHELKKILVN